MARILLERLEDELPGDRRVLAQARELGRQVVDRAGDLLGLGRAVVADEVPDVDRADHRSSSSSKSWFSSGRANSASAAVAGPRRRSRPNSTWSSVRFNDFVDDCEASRIRRIEFSNWASLAST